jgi:hypothetical protein
VRYVCHYGTHPRNVWVRKFLPSRHFPLRRCPVRSCPVYRRPVYRCPVYRCPVYRCPVRRCPVFGCSVHVLSVSSGLCFTHVACLTLFTGEHGDCTTMHEGALALEPGCCHAQLPEMCSSTLCAAGRECCQSVAICARPGFSRPMNVFCRFSLRFTPVCACHRSLLVRGAA